MAERLPEYVCAPIRRYLKSLINSLTLMDICMHGITIVTRQPLMNQRLTDFKLDKYLDAVASYFNCIRARLDERYHVKEKSS